MRGLLSEGLCNGSFRHTGFLDSPQKNMIVVWVSDWFAICTKLYLDNKKMFL